MSQREKQVIDRSVFWALASAITFGLVTTLVRLTYEAGGTPVAVLTIRFAGGFLAAGVLLLAIRKRPVVGRKGYAPTALASASLFIMGVGYLGAILYIPVGLAALIFYSYPLMIAVTAPVFEGAAVGAARAFAFALAFAGLALALGPSYEILDWRGVAFGFAAAAAVAVNFIANGKALRHTDFVSLTFYSHLGSLPLMAMAFPLIAGLDLPGMEGRGFAFPASMGGLAALTGATTLYIGGILALLMALRVGQPSKLSMIFNIEPLISITAAAVLLSERLEATQYAGGALVIVALMLAGKSQKVRS